MLLLLAGARPACAEHLGVIGPVYAIAEPDLLAVIRGQLESAQRNGRLPHTCSAEATERVRATSRRRRPCLESRAPARATNLLRRSSIEISFQPVTDAEGRVIVAPGTRLNALGTVSLSKRRWSSSMVVTQRR
ncbi:MAG: hypothetical protein IPL06_20015 [Betaproteobacteria bacterium]|nr:hypothetical protein [Betaproteobacteria bacterium]